MFTLENTFTQYPDILSVAQMREILAIGKNTAYDLLKSNEIESIRIGKTHKIPKQSVIEYLNRHMIQN